MLYEENIFRTLDLARAYDPILTNPDDVPKTATTTPFSFFEYLFTPSGLTQSRTHLSAVDTSGGVYILIAKSLNLKFFKAYDPE